MAASGAEGFAEATRAAAAPLEIVARGFDQPWVATVVAIGAVTAMAGVLLNLVLGLSRVLLAMARRGEVPTGLDHVNPTTSSPDRAVVVAGVIIGGLVLLGDVKTTWSFSAFTVLVYYGITNLAALLLPEAHRRFPRFIAMAGLVSCFGLAFFVELEIWLSGLALLAAGFAFRAVVRRSGSRA